MVINGLHIVCLNTSYAETIWAIEIYNIYIKLWYFGFAFDSIFFSRNIEMYGWVSQSWLRRSLCVVRA